MRHMEQFSKFLMEPVDKVFIKFYLKTGINRKFSLYTKKGANRTFFGPKSLFLKYSLKMFIDFFKNCIS